MKHTRRTGTVFPRDYGHAVKTDATTLFISPTRYALASLHLLDREGTDRMLASYARRHGMPLFDLQQEWRHGVRKRFDATPESLVAKAGVFDVRQYAGNFTGVVRSKSGMPAHQVRLSQTGDNYRCDCPDDFWNDLKAMDVLCSHGAALALSLSRDKHGMRGSLLNDTGLTGKELADAPDTPYRLTPSSVGDLVVDYVTGRGNHFDLNRVALASTAVYTAHLANRVAAGTAQFMVLPQRARTVHRTKLTAAEDRYLGACEALEGRIGEELADQGFAYEGRSLVFQGGEFEAVARRFRNGADVYELVRAEGSAPLVLHKSLGPLGMRWLESVDPDLGVPQTRTRYLGMDDVTRRESRITVLRPGLDLDVFVPQSLAGAYR